MPVCSHCGQDLEVPVDPEDLRPMPELQGDSDHVPRAIVCRHCDGVVRVVYPSWTGPATGEGRRGPDDPRRR